MVPATCAVAVIVVGIGVVVGEVPARDQLGSAQILDGRDAGIEHRDDHAIALVLPRLPACGSGRGATDSDTWDRWAGSGVSRATDGVLGRSAKPLIGGGG